MADSLDDFRKHEVAQARAQKPQHPSGYEPGVEWNGKSGQITSTPTAERPDWSALMEKWRLDPNVVEIDDDTVSMRSWDALPGKGLPPVTMFYYRANLRLKRPGSVGIEELLAQVRKARPRRNDRKGQGPSGALDTDVTTAAFMPAISDPQLGKEGTAATIDRFIAGVDGQVQRLKDLRRIGRKLDTVVMPLLGDLVESCDGHYAMQTFSVELDGREQRRLGRQLVLYAVDAFRPLADRVIVPAVAGNHGENRKDGKAFTTFGDNADLEIPEGVSEACAANPAAYGHVSFVIPQQTLTLTLDVGGVIVGFAHGHQAKRGGTTPQQKVATWWSGQAFGQRPVGDARILMTGHSHHLSVIDHGPRTHIQAPTMDSGSQWFEESSGANSHSGMLSIVVGAGYPMGWGDLHVT